MTRKSKINISNSKIIKIKKNTCLKFHLILCFQKVGDQQKTHTLKSPNSIYQLSYHNFIIKPFHMENNLKSHIWFSSNCLECEHCTQNQSV